MEILAITNFFLLLILIVVLIIKIHHNDKMKREIETELSFLTRWVSNNKERIQRIEKKQLKK